MSLWKYKYFVDVVESGSFTKAGKKNYVSQTAISQQISSLEKTVGGKLIDRESKELVITELGEIVYKRAKEMLKIDDEMSSEIRQVKEKTFVRIGVDSSIHRRFWKNIVEMLDRCYEDHDKHFRFSKVDAREAGAMLEDNFLDIFIGYDIVTSEALSGIEAAPLCANRIGVYISHDSTIKQKGKLTLQDLKNNRRYCTESYSCSMQKIEKDDAGEENASVKCEDNLLTMKLKTEFNDGYAFVDSALFDGTDGKIKLLADYDVSCILRFYYRKNAFKKNFEKIYHDLKTIL